jgi:hypothetical protein
MKAAVGGGIGDSLISPAGTWEGIGVGVGVGAAGAGAVIVGIGVGDGNGDFVVGGASGAAGVEVGTSVRVCVTPTAGVVGTMIVVRTTRVTSTVRSTTRVTTSGSCGPQEANKRAIQKVNASCRLIFALLI